MNRYLWIALLCLLFTIASILSIWIIDISDPTIQKQLELTLAFIRTASSVATLLFAIIGIRTKHTADEKPQVEFIVPPPPSQPLLNLEESITQYLLSLEAFLDDFGTNKTIFIELSAESRAESPFEDIELVQSFEWASREWSGERFVTSRAPIEFMDAHNQFRRYVLLGDPGAGKTSCLEHLTLHLISNYREGNSQVLPLYANLSDWKDRRTTALEFLRTAFTNLAGANNYLGNEFDNLLAQGRLLVILDGLNEMPDRYFHDEQDQKPGMLRPIDFLIQMSSGKFFRSRIDPRERSLRELAASRAIRTHFVVSCRTHEFYGSPDWQEVCVLPMDEDQISQFVISYMSEKEAKIIAEILNQNENLRSIAKNPFFLRSMIMAFSPELSVIRNKGQFLEYLTSRLLQREEKKGLIFQKAKVMRKAGKLAYNMLTWDLIGSHIGLDEIGRRYNHAINVLLGTGLVISRGDGRISFYHQLIQEFFVAYAVREKFIRVNVGKLLNSKKWSEAIILANEIGSQICSLPRIISALKFRNGIRFRLWIGDIVLLNLYAFLIGNLAIDAIFDASTISPIIASQPLKSLFFAIILPITIRYVRMFFMFNPRVIANAAYILGEIGNPIAIENLVNTFQRIPAGEARVQIGKSLAKFGNTAIPKLIEGLSTNKYRQKVGCVGALGLTKSSLAIDPLLILLSENDPKLLSSTVTALSLIDDPRVGPAIVKLLKTPPSGCRSFFSQISIAPAFKMFGEFNPEMFGVLTEIIRNSEFEIRRSQGIQYVGKYGFGEGFEVLNEILVNDDETVALRKTATSSIAQLRAEGVTTALLHAYDKIPDLKKLAIESLSKISNIESIQELHSSLNHQDWKVRQSVIRSICLISHTSSIIELTKMVNDSNENVRETLAEVCGIIGDPGLVDTLITLCWDANHKVREKALQSLDYAFPDIAKNTFLEFANENTFPDRVEVISLLIHYRYPEVKEALLNLYADPDIHVRSRAGLVLRRLDQSLAHELHSVHPSDEVTLLMRMITHLKDRFKLDEFAHLAREAKFRGFPEEQTWNQVLKRIQEDSELKRKFRPLLITSLILIALAIFVMPGLLSSLAIRFLNYAGSIYWKYKWISVTMIVLAGLSLLPGIRDGRQVKFLGGVYSIVRTFGSVSLLILSAFAIIQNFILCSSIMLFMVILLAIFRKRLAIRAESLFQEIAMEAR